MGVDENPYRAPEARIVERSADQPRPILIFLAGAGCFGASVSFLILEAGAGRKLVLAGLDRGWLEVFTDRRDATLTAGFLVPCGLCAATLPIAGRSFLTRQGGRGRRTLLAFAASFLGLVALILWP